MALPPSSSNVSKSQLDRYDIELRISIPADNVTALPFVPSWTYHVSFQNLVNQGINVAVETFQESRPARKAVQHTLQGLFVDSYDVAPPTIQLAIAAEMPQAARKFITIDTTPYKKIKTSVYQQYLSQFGLQSTKQSVGGGSTFTFTSLMDAMLSVSSSRLPPNTSSPRIYYSDFARRVHYEVSLLSIAPTAGINRQNVILYSLDMIVLRSMTEKLTTTYGKTDVWT